MRRILTFAALLAAGFLWTEVSSSLAGERDRGMRDRENANEVGIWKSYAPEGLQGEFDNYDPVGLMAGDLIRTDCSINYTDPDTRKTYCFNSATSMQYFAQWPKAYASKAKASLARMKAEALTN